MKTIKIGIIGAGRIGRVHAENIAKFVPEMEIKTIADPYMSEETVEFLRRLRISNIVKDADVILNDPEIKAVVVCSPTDLHAEYAIKVAEAGKDVFVEKPVDYRIDRVKEVIAAAKNLKIVVRAGAGYDNVDLAAASARGIVVMNTPGQNSNAVAELALAMMIFMSRNRFTPGTGTELQGKTLGIHAYGNVGRLVGRKGKALGMNVVAYDPFIADGAVFEADGVKKVASVEELYRVSDFLSLHIPATAQTKGSIGYDLMMSMPKGATLVNTARKEVIDEEGVARAMTEREDLKYITDIAAGNQAELDEKFGKRVFATAKKMGAETAEANVNAGLAAANQIVDFLKNGNTRFQVNK